MSKRNDILLASSKNLLQTPQGECHPLAVTGKLALATWLVSSNSWQQREYQKGLLNFSQMQGEKRLSLITDWPETNGLVGVINRKLIHFDALWIVY